MAILNREIKSKVFQAIMDMPSYLGRYEEHDGILTFLSKIWDLKGMPSEDTRYKNAYQDTNQHIVNNDDWTTEYLFIDRFKLLEGEENNFIRFLEAVVDPTVRKDRDEITLYVAKINPIIEGTGYRLVLSDYFEELPVYKFRKIDLAKELPIDILINRIPVYFNNAKSTFVYPNFSLTSNNWDDFSMRTTFEITYFKSARESESLGRVKGSAKQTKFCLRSLQNFQ